MEDLSLQAIAHFINLDISSDKDFLTIVELASSVCGAPVAFISLLDEDTQYFKVKKGLEYHSMPRKHSFCNYVIEQNDVAVIPNVLKDKRFAQNPMISSEPDFIFYAGAPLVNKEGHHLGILAILDTKERSLSEEQQTMLKILAEHALNTMELRIGLELLEKKHREVEEQTKFIEVASIRLRSFFESSTNFQMLIGREGEIIDFNKTAFNFIKRVHRAEIKIGDLLLPFIAPDFVDIFLKNYKQALNGLKSAEVGSTNYGAHGIIWWEASFEPASDPLGNIIGISYIIRNITEQKLKEQKILEQNQSLLNIAHIQAHEFRAPLTTVMGLLNLIEEENYQTTKEYLKLLNQAVNNLDIKIRDIVTNIEDNIVVNTTTAAG